MQPISHHVRVLLLGSLLGASAWAQTPPARSNTPNTNLATAEDSTDPSAGLFADTDAPMPPVSNRAGTGLAQGQQRHEHATAVPWSQLSNEQQSVLAPLQSQWMQLAPRRQQRLAERSQAWSQLPPERRQMVGERLQRWAQMSPQQRQAAARGAHAFRSLPDADRQRLRETYQRFQTLPPEQRRALQQQWRTQHAKERGLRERPIR